SADHVRHAHLIIGTHGEGARSVEIGDRGVPLGAVLGYAADGARVWNSNVTVQDCVGVGANPIAKVGLAPVVEKSVLVDVFRRIAIVRRRFQKSIGRGGGVVLCRVHHVLQTRLSADHACRSLAAVGGVRISPQAPVIGEVENIAVVGRIVHAGAAAGNAAIQPLGQVAHIQLNHVHNALDRAGRISIVAAGGV